MSYAELGADGGAPAGASATADPGEVKLDATCSVGGCEAGAGASGLCTAHRQSVVGGWDASASAPQWQTKVVEVSVEGRGPLSRGTGPRRHAMYELAVTARDSGESWTVRRRYAHFALLQRSLAERFPESLARAPFPGKSASSTSAAVTRQRSVALPVWLHSIQRADDAVCDDWQLRAFLGAEGAALGAYERHFGKDSALISGFLDKRAEIIRRLPGTWWKRRFVVVSSNRLQLQYYAGPEEDPTRPVATIALYHKGVPVRVEESRDLPGEEHCFRIVGARTHWFRCESAQEARQWVAALQPSGALASALPDLEGAGAGAVAGGAADAFAL